MVLVVVAGASAVLLIIHFRVGHVPIGRSRLQEHGAVGVLVVVARTTTVVMVLVVVARTSTVVMVLVMVLVVVAGASAVLVIIHFRVGHVPIGRSRLQEHGAVGVLVAVARTTTVVMVLVV